MTSGRTPGATPEPQTAKVEGPQGPGLRYWLEYAGHAFELRQGPLVLGRSADCNLVLDDGLVSRRHAQFRVERGRVLVEDLNSANGVLVNDERIHSLRPLVPGDRITVGKQQMIIRARTMGAQGGRGKRFGAQTLHAGGGERSEQFDTLSGVDTLERSREALELIGGVVDKVLALGRAEEAERMLTPRLLGLMESVESGLETTDRALTQAARYAVKLAGATTKGAWADYVFRLYAVVKRPLPGEVVDELYQVLRRVDSVNVDVLREYVSTLRAHQESFGPAERFLVQRIEGLKRLATLR